MLGFGVSLGRHEVFMSKQGFRSARLRDGELLPYIVSSFDFDFHVICSVCKRSI